MGIWAWVQPVDRIWKVISDDEKGTLYVYNEKGELILERKGMSKEEISFIEENFLQIVATDLSGARSPAVIDGMPILEHNCMYA